MVSQILVVGRSDDCAHRLAPRTLVILRREVLPGHGFDRSVCPSASQQFRILPAWEGPLSKSAESSENQRER